MVPSASRKGERRRSRRGPLLLGATVVVGLFALATAAAFAATRSDLAGARRQLVYAREAVARRDDAGAGSALAGAERRLVSARRRSRRPPLVVLRPVPVLSSVSRATEGAARAGLEGAAAGRAVLAASRDFPASGRSELQGQDLSAFRVAALRSEGALDRATRHLAAARSALAGPANAALPPVSGEARAMRAEIGGAERQLAGARRGLALLADLTAPTTDVRLLLLAQDSLELRPSGGYIGSYGVIHFLHGTATLEKFAATEDLPAPDPPLEPPPDLAPWLPRFWGVSNANWWPDFPTSARAARELYRRQGGGEVDGVVALTEYATARMVGAVGPLKLPGYAKPVVEAGFDQRAVYEVELKRPLDNPRKEFLIELSGVLFDRIFHLPADRLPALSKAVDSSVGAGDIQVWFADPARQAQIAGSVVAGALPRQRGDFLMLVDANLSASKANLGLTKSATYRVRRDRHGRVLAHLDVLVRNDAAADANINPYYNGFLRVYAARGAALTGRRRDQFDQGPALDGPFQVFEQALDVKPKGMQRVVFDYELPARTAPGGTYSLLWARQPGTPRDSLSVVVAGRTASVPGRGRTLALTRSLRGNAVAAWLRERWLVRRLGL